MQKHSIYTQLGLSFPLLKCHFIVVHNPIVVGDSTGHAKPMLLHVNFVMYNY